jgi:hypothetical protein
MQLLNFVVIGLLSHHRSPVMDQRSLANKVRPRHHRGFFFSSSPTPWRLRRKGNDQIDCCSRICRSRRNSVQAMPLARIHQQDSMITQVREACGPGRVRINGVCVARTTTRQVAEESVGVRAGVEALALSGTETPSNGAVFRRRAKWTTYCRTWCSGSARSSSC